MEPGKFIALYGVNNIGKSTQAKVLVDTLKKAGYEAVYLKYPVYDLPPTGPKLNAILRNNKQQNISEEELQTLFRQNRLDYESELQKMLAEGKIIVAEDYTGTGIAWGVAKGLDLKWIEELNKNLLREIWRFYFEGKDISMPKNNIICMSRMMFW